MKSLVLMLAAGATLAGCAGTEVTRTSQNTMIIEAGAAPVCGARGAARVAAKSAAIETIRAGYDRYLIGGAQSQNNVSVTQLPGHVQTSGTFYGNSYQATSTYVPGGTIVSGSHDRQLAVMMFKNGEPGSEQALDARQQLGPDWKEIAERRILTCL